MSGLVHADLMHLIFNMMYVLFFCVPARDLHRHGVLFVVLYPGGPADQPHGHVLQAAAQSGLRVPRRVPARFSAVLFASIVYFPDMRLEMDPADPLPDPRAAVRSAVPGSSYVLRVQASARAHQSRCAPRAERSRGCCSLPWRSRAPTAICCSRFSEQKILTAQKREAPSQKAGLRAAAVASKDARADGAEELGWRLATITLQLPKT